MIENTPHLFVNRGLGGEEKMEKGMQRNSKVFLH